jgi:phasin family protein
VVSFNKLAVAQLEKYVHLQLDAYKAFVELTLRQLKAGAEISDAEGLKAFWAKQSEVISAVREKQLEHLKALAELGTGFNVEVKKLAEKSVKPVVKKAA